MKCALLPVDRSVCALPALTHVVAELHGRSAVQLHLLDVQAPPMHPFPGSSVANKVVHLAVVPVTPVK